MPIGWENKVRERERESKVKGKILNGRKEAINWKPLHFSLVYSPQFN